MSEVSRFKITPDPEFDLADLLAESRNLLVDVGWDTGEFRTVENEYDEPDETGVAEIIDYTVLGYCAMGAVLYSQHIDESECSTDPRALAVAEALCRAAGIKEHHTEVCVEAGKCACIVNWITTWNDAQTSAEPVLDAFMKAEKAARSGNVDE